MAVISGLVAGGAALAAQAGVGTAITAAGLGLSAGAAYQGAQAKKDEARYNSQVAMNNRQVAIDNARDVELRGRQAVFDQRMQVAKELGTIRAATAGAGLEVDLEGTTQQDLVNNMVENGELDVMRLRNNIDREKRRALVQAGNFEAQAGQFELQRSSISPFRSALVSGVGGLGQSPDVLGLLAGD